jgi:hypothetical protein
MNVKFKLMIPISNPLIDKAFQNSRSVTNEGELQDLIALIGCSYIVAKHVYIIFLDKAVTFL